MKPIMLQCELPRIVLENRGDHFVQFIFGKAQEVFLMLDAPETSAES